MEILLKSIFSGLLIGVVLMISKLFGEKVAGILSMVPLTFVLAFIFVTASEKKTETIIAFLNGGFLGILFFILFVLVLYILTRYFDYYWLNLLGSYIIWFLVVGVWMYFFKK